MPQEPRDCEIMKAEIAAQIYEACEKLGAGPQLLSIIGSYGDTLCDDDVLMLLIRHNSGESLFDESICNTDTFGTIRH
jgi:hypothetical protein